MGAADVAAPPCPVSSSSLSAPPAPPLAFFFFFFLAAPPDPPSAATPSADKKAPGSAEPGVEPEEVTGGADVAIEAVAPLPPLPLLAVLEFPPAFASSSSSNAQSSSSAPFFPPFLPAFPPFGNGASLGLDAAVGGALATVAASTGDLSAPEPLSSESESMSAAANPGFFGRLANESSSSLDMLHNQQCTRKFSNGNNEKPQF